MITVGKVNGASPAGSVVVRADRKSPLGNPFYMATEAMRDEVCIKFAAWMKDQLGSDKSNPFVVRLREVYKISQERDVHLTCWCAPRRCHCDTIKSFLDGHLNKI